jgi:hypothetical protein
VIGTTSGAMSRPSDGPTEQIGAPPLDETGSAPRSEVPITEHRWGAPPAPVRADGIFRPEDQAFHLWASEHDAEAACGETTGEEFELLPKGELPPVDERLHHLRGHGRWTEPGEESMLPVEPQRELALPKAVQEKKSTCFCGEATFKGRQKKLILGQRWHMRGECGALALATARASPATPTECLAPECENKGLGRWPIRCAGCTRRPGTVRIEWYFQRYPERKPKPAAPPAKKLLPKKAGHG